MRKVLLTVGFVAAMVVGAVSAASAAREPVKCDPVVPVQCDTSWTVGVPSPTQEPPEHDWG